MTHFLCHVIIEVQKIPFNKVMGTGTLIWIKTRTVHWYTGVVIKGKIHVKDVDFPKSSSVVKKEFKIV